MTPITFFIPGIPKTAGSKRAFMRPGMRFPVVVDDCKQSRPWKSHVTMVAHEALPLEFGLLTGPLKLTLAFQRTRPKGHFKKDGSLSTEGHRNPFPTQKPDVLKLARAVEDALTQIVWADDAQIVQEVLSKVYADKYGVRVTIEMVGDEGPANFANPENCEGRRVD